MTEQEWRACEHPQAMQVFLRGQVSARKAVLFSVACCRHIGGLLEAQSARWVELAERCADGGAGVDELRRGFTLGDGASYDIAGQLPRRTVLAAGGTLVCALMSLTAPPNAPLGCSDEEARRAVGETAQAADIPPAPRRRPVVWKAIRGWFSPASASAPSPARLAEQAEARAQADLLRCLFGNPFRPVAADPDWLSHAGGTAVAVARRIYEERDFAALPVLADALMDAGCDNAEVLEHCRSAGPHARGCWVVDLLLGKV